MAWNYRKRIKIAPGVHLNLSKGGVSTSVGPKGAKVTIGKQGTFLHTSIPGTGLYSRQKISDKRNTQNEKSTIDKQHNMDNKNKADLKPQNSWGCGCLLNILGILAIIFLVGNLIELITGHFDNSKENISALKTSGVVAVIFILVHIDKFVSFINGITSAYREIFPSKPYSTKEIEKMISEENDESCKTFLRGLETLYNKEKADEIISVGDDLTIKQRETFMKLSSAFDELRSCDKTWLIVSQSENTEYRSLVSNSLYRRKIRFTCDVFNNVRIKEAFFVPSFSDGDYYYFFYPKYIISYKGKG